MTSNPATGVWSVTGNASWYGRYYALRGRASSSARPARSRPTSSPTRTRSRLSTNSQRSQIVDLADAALKPSGWDSYGKPRLDAPEDIVLYELHVRDFSANDPTVPANLKGTFKAFTLPTPTACATCSPCRAPA